MSDKNKSPEIQTATKPTAAISQEDVKVLDAELAAKTESIEKLTAELKQSEDKNAELVKELAESNKKLNEISEKYQELQAGKGKSDTKKFSWTKKFASEPKKK